MSAVVVTPVSRLFEAHLTVTDLDRSIAFYRDRLGFELAELIPARQVAFFWIGARGTTMLGLWTGGSAPLRTTTHIAFAATLDDVIAAPKALQLAGITPLDFDGIRRMSLSYWRGCRPHRSTSTILMGTCWNTSPCWPKIRVPTTPS